MNDLEKDAARYRFLKSLKVLELTSSARGCMKWIREDGSSFISSHYLAGNGTCFAAYETLDEIIDAAMVAEGEKHD